MIDTSATNGSRNFIIPMYNSFVHETSSVYLTVAKVCVALIITRLRAKMQIYENLGPQNYF